MQALFEIILPVFLVIGFGYVAVWRKLFSKSGLDGLQKFTQNFAIPCLLFKAIAELDLDAYFDPGLLGSFYLGAASGFLAGLLGARYVFGKTWDYAVAIGFCCLYSNSLLLGLPITERAYGVDALAANYAIIAIHAPFCYGIGVTAMEVVRNRGKGLVGTTAKVFGAMFRNALVIGITLGLIVNVSGFAMPAVFTEALDLVIRAALPAALFALGGTLFFYRPEGDLRLVFYVCAVSLILHPVVVYLTAQTVDLTDSQLRSAVVTAAMAPGVNTYIFASMYGVALRVAATSVLFSTALSILTASAWIAVLP